MKKIMVILISLSIIFIGCQKKVEKAEEPKEKAQATKEKEVKVTVKPAKAPLPKFSVFFSSLEDLQIEDFNLVLPEKFDDAEKKVHIVAFELGKLSADGIIATKARNKTELVKIAEKLIEYSKFIGVKNEILSLADKIKTLIEDEKWNELEMALDNYRSKVELALYEAAEYDVFNLVQIGGWTEALYRITNLLNVEYKKGKTDILEQKGIVNDLVTNIKNFNSFKDEAFYPVMLNKYVELKEMLDNKEKSTFTKEEVTKIHNLAGEIINNMK